MLDYPLDVLPDKLDCRAIVEKGQRVVSWMAVDGHAAVIARFTLHADKSWDRAGLMIHGLPSYFIVNVREDSRSH